MRTSKKILSFFLAVVMVVTTCSVGFTAFAKSNDNQLWQTTGVDADSAFDTLNKLADNLPSLLMGIDLISEPVYKKGAKKLGKAVEDLTSAEKEQIKNETTLQDLLGVLQPTLIGALASTSQSDFVQNIYGDKQHGLSNYNYLSGSTGSVDYYTLAALCYNYKDNNKLSKDSRNQLEEWLYGKESDRTLTGNDASGKTVKYSADSLWYLATLYNQQTSNQDKIDATIDEIGQRYNKAFKDQKILNVEIDDGVYVGSTYDTASLNQLKQANDYYQLTSEEQAIVDECIASFNKTLEVYGVGIKATDVADYLYYAYGMGSNAIQASLYIKLMHDGGYDLSYTDEDGNGQLGSGVVYDGFKVSSTENNLVSRLQEICAKASDCDTFLEAIKLMLDDQDPSSIDDETAQVVGDWFVDSLIQSDLLELIIYGGDGEAYASPYYAQIIKGLAADYGNNGEPMNLSDINSAIDAQLPKGYNKNWQDGDTFFISDEELEQLHALFNNIAWNNALDANGNGKTYVTTYLGDGVLTFTDTDGDGAKKTINVPSSLKGTGTLDFWYQIANLYSKASLKDADASAKPVKETNYINLIHSFADYPSNVATSKTEYTSSNSLVDYSLSDAGTGINKTENSRRSYSKADIQKWADASYNYIATKTISGYFGIDTSKIATSDNTYKYDRTYAMNDLIDIDGVFNKIVEKKTATQTDVVLTDAQKAILNGDNADLTGSVGTEIVNVILNNTIGDIVDPSTSTGQLVDSVLKALLKTDVNLQAVLTDVWANLNDNPVKTIVNLLPVLAVLVNELVEPILLAEPGDAQRSTTAGFIYDLLGDGLLGSVNAKSGSYIGIDQLAWDLNSLLPQLMHWLKNDGSYESVGGTYWNGGNAKTGYLSELGSSDYVTKDYTANDLISEPNLVLKYDKVVDKNGRELTYKESKDENGNTVYTYSYNGNTANNLTDVLANIPSATRFNIQYTYEAGVPKITGIYIADKALKYAKLSDLKNILAGAITVEDGQIGTGLYEVIDELANMFTTAVDTYVNTPELRNQVKGYANDGTGAATNKGLNNITVAIPQLFDIMENLGAEKYGIDKNAWTYCYDGKIVTGKDASTGDDGVVSNSKMTEFKNFAANPDPVKIFDCFAQIFVEDWLDAILGLVNNLISSNNSEFAKNLPIVTGLLQSIGGFGETSALTDLFNSIFQITRESDYSFTFEKQSSGFVGLDKDNAYFLITNVNKLVDVIQSLIQSFKKSDSSSGSSNSNSSTTAPTQAVQTNNSSVGLSAYKSKDVKSVDSTIEKLDKALSSLLADSSINGYAINKTNNLTAGVISLLSNYIGANSANATVDLLNTYLYYLNGEDSRTADSKGNVNPKDIYTNEGLTALVVRTYSLIETLVANLTDKYSYTYTNANNVSAKYNLISEAVNGLISPDSLAVRIKDTDIKNASGKLKKLASWSDAVNDNGTINVSINWGVSAGNRDEFMNGLSTSLRLLTSIIGVLLIDTGIYQNALYPILDTLAVKTGITVDTPEKFADKSNPYRDEVFLGIVNPIVALLDKFLEKPVTTLLNLVSAIGVVLDDTTAPTLASTIANAVKPIASELNGLANILRIKSDKLGALSPTLATFLDNITTKTFGKLITVNEKNEIGIEAKGYLLSGNNIIPIINTLLAKTGIKLNNINWNALGKSASPAQTLLFVLDYVIEFVKTNNNLTTIVKLIAGNKTISDGITKLIKYIETGKLDAMGLLKVIDKLLDFTQSPTEVYWAYKEYKQHAISFKYPDGISATDAANAVSQLDGAIDGVMALLTSFGLVNSSNLKGVVNGLLFTNANLTSLAKALYGALDTNKIAPYLNMVGITVSPKGVANLLTDKSYGKTFTSAAKTLKSAKSWKKVKTVNWGFKDGSANAEQGFVNALAAMLRPFNDVLNVFLNEGTIDLSPISIDKTSTSLDIKDSNGKVISKIVLTYQLKKGVLTLTAKDDMNSDSKLSTIKLDLNALNLGLNGVNGYESAIVPLLDVLQVSNSKIKTYKQYQKDCKKAKDNVLLDVLNPLMSFVDTLLDKPFDTLTSVLPNLAYFIDNNGIGQLLDNLLAPVTNILKTAKSAGVDIDKILPMVLGKDLGKYLTSLLKIKGVKLNVKLADLKSCNIQDIVVPLVNTLLKKTGIKLPEFKWATIASHGKVVTSKSVVKNAEGKFTNKEVVANKGEVLVAVLRYISDTLIKNSKSIKTLLTSIKDIKSNDMLKSILSSVFNTISIAEKDDVVRAVFYFLTAEPTNAFWDYTAYKTGSFDFSYPKEIDTDFLKNLPPMLDGLVGGLVDLNSTIGGLIFKDDVINSLLTGLYGAIDGVKVGSSSLTSILAQTGIDFSTKNVAKLLTDEAYGQTYEAQAKIIANAGSWSKINKNSIKWGVKDADTFFHALVAVLRPIYGVLDVLLNDAYLGIFDIVRVPGSNGYTSSIVPLMEAFSMYNIKTQYQYREDIKKAYDNILLDIINPLWDKVEDILSAPLETLFEMLPNLALFIGNDGLCQILDNLLTPVSALVDAIKPVVNLNDLLTAVFSALNVNLNSLLGKIGVTNFKLDIYDLNATLKPILGGDAIIPLVNNILGLIKIGGKPLGIKLNDVNWLQLASHGKTVVTASQAATYGARIYVEGDSSETLIAVLRYLIETVNTGDNFDQINGLIGGLIGGANSTVSDVVNQVLGMLQGDTDEVISELVNLLQTLA